MTTSLKLVAALACTVFGATAAAAQGQYLCVADQATGYAFEGGRWVAQQFNVSDDRFLVKEVDEFRIGSRVYRAVVRKMGESADRYQCEQATVGDARSNRIICGGLGVGMIIDTKTLRYQELYGVGYVGGEDGPANTPSLAIGRCSPL